MKKGVEKARKLEWVHAAKHTLPDTRASELHVEVAYNLSPGRQQLCSGSRSVLLQVLSASRVSVNRLRLFCAYVARLWLMRRGL